MMKCPAVNAATYIGASESGPGLETVRKHLPQCHSKRPDVRRRRKLPSRDALRSTPFCKAPKKTINKDYNSQNNCSGLSHLEMRSTVKITS